MQVRGMAQRAVCRVSECLWAQWTSCLFVFLGATEDAVEQVTGLSCTTEDGIFVEEGSVGWHDLQPRVFANDEEGPAC